MAAVPAIFHTYNIPQFTGAPDDRVTQNELITLGSHTVQPPPPIHRFVIPEQHCIPTGTECALQSCSIGVETLPVGVDTINLPVRITEVHPTPLPPVEFLLEF